MLDPFFEWVKRTMAAIWGWFAALIRAVIAPFTATYRFYQRSGWIIRSAILVIVLLLLIPYVYFFWMAIYIRNFDVDYAAQFKLQDRKIAAGEQVAAEGGTDTTRTCGRSAIVDITSYLIDFNVNQNSWISAMPQYKGGLFGLAWDDTPWLDNKASFQRGVHQAITRTTVELTDTLGRIRGTSQVDEALQNARGAVQFDEYTWYFNPYSNRPFGPTTTSPSWYRTAIAHLGDFNDRLEKCNATFDARADNLLQFMDRIAKDIGATSAAIKSQAERSDAGWFDVHADNQFMFALGQLYAYRGLMQAARVDFRDVIEKRRLGPLWDNMEDQIASAVILDPFIISNGREDGWIMPTHLTTIGFYILRVRANLVEIRSVLDR